MPSFPRNSLPPASYAAPVADSRALPQDRVAERLPWCNELMCPRHARAAVAELVAQPPDVASLDGSTQSLEGIRGQGSDLGP